MVFVAGFRQQKPSKKEGNDVGKKRCKENRVFDRQERGQGERSAVQEVESTLGAPVISIIGLGELIAHLEGSSTHAAHLDAVKAYRDRYGV